jgi:hypothetical protein
MDRNYRPWSLLVLALVIAACGRIDAEAISLEPQATTALTIAVSDTSIADSDPISDEKPAAGSYRQRYLSVFAPLIVHCLNELGLEATYDARLGVLLAEFTSSQPTDRDGAMRFCVAGSHSHLAIYAD